MPTNSEKKLSNTVEIITYEDKEGHFQEPEFPELIDRINDKKV